ncbi:sugar phosphate isomerase/epimerase [Candidatus Poribacteria bacterium]|jgi:sugar phosphate isomerase/epimerase|nr:sugar phosphate isomerase/epimerase [Candidatus Poribacteria bacterium]MBT7808493.1 sugar phosphate isomerase/epimerase [Candidatus Poribacteria bacterium]
MNRREFLGCLAVGSAWLPLGMPSFAGTTPIHERLGVNLWTVRKRLESDLRGIVHGLAKIGLREAEVVNWAGRPLDDLITALRDVGIDPVGVHFEDAIITGNWDLWGDPEITARASEYGIEYAIDIAVEQDLRYLGIAYLFPSEREGLDSYKRLADSMNAAGERCNAAGVRFFYHNHAFEFEPMDGQMPFDLLMERADPALVGFELDVCWASVGGVDPVHLLRTYSDRIEMLHVKDRTAAVDVMYDVEDIVPDSQTEVGSGALDFHAILTAASAAGVKHYFVEQDFISGDELESLDRSVSYLRELGI